ncbi:IclR family transcriptional regulator [Microbacterium marinilacus]|uniref:IclR family transcriptional regulator n=1 Tax=Microbacterium marinilacus TaxID=415209 RepID=A0ABP7BS24_9MICO|nr:IclR family transcriptional regulator [Microbacterium marinilacus]MBY0689107.1 IclR family transcriptional regulator [Microbacterium marinilacus]
MTPADPRAAAPAADHTLRVLAFLARQRGPVAARTIAAALELPRSTVYRLLRVMVEHAFVVHLPEERRYGLGVAAYELSSGFSRQEPLARLGTPVLTGLVDRIGQSAHLAVLHGRDVVYIVEARAPRRPPLVTDVGVRLPAAATASGRAQLAALPAAQVRALYPDASAFTGAFPRAPRGYVALREALRDVRARGFAWEDGDVTDGLASVGVVVRDHAGWPAASIAVTFPRDDVPEPVVPALVAEVTAAADLLARRIHGRAPVG